MHRFWEPVIEPLIERMRPARIVEIGADAGGNTLNLLAWCENSGAVLHSIDPAPKFDATELAERYESNFVFYRELSLNVIPRLSGCDLVLIDGDHNWYTVFNELKLLEKRCKKTGEAYPLVILHDIGWPYGRRDLYYNPENIPAEFLKPYKKEGILPGRAALAGEEGLNPHLCNAIYENDYQNGVLTAVEDFLEETGFRLELFSIQGLNGLGLIVPAELLQKNTELAEFLKNWKTGSEFEFYLQTIEAQRVGKELEINTLRKKYQGRIDELQAARQADAEKLENLREEKRNLENRLGEQKEEIRRLKEVEKEMLALNNRMEKLAREVQGLLRSNRWKVGNFIGAVVQKLLLKKSGPTAVEHIHELIREFASRQKGPAKTEEPPCGKTGSGAENFKTGATEVPAKKKITVIITVYNAFDEASACIESVLQKTSPRFRVLLLDDCSPDERIWPMLQSFAEAHPHVTARRNEENLGYTATINKGCRMAGEDDVVLLNSDTIVTARWLEKLAACAASAENVATVTPLSNAAGAYSIPKNQTVNAIPGSMSIENMAALVEKLSPRLRPQVPTGNGFCMYITRWALNAAGLFDEESFPRGYGEENDFCMRAMQKGFVHLIDDATFIYHKRSASFQETKKDIIRTSTKRLQQMHPEYKGLVSEWLKNDPLDDFRRHIQNVLKEEGPAVFGIAAQNDKPAVLYVLHTGGGGVRHTSFDLIREIAKSCRCYLLQTGLNRWYLYKADGDGESLVKEYSFRDNWKIHEPLTGERFKTIREIAATCSPDIVHIRHFLGNHPDIVHYFKTAGSRVVLSLHDFYTVCPTIQLVDDTGNYCGGFCGSEGGECKCSRKWFVSMPPLKNGFVYKWRAVVADALERCDALVVTSATTQEVIAKHYPFLQEDKFFVIEHGRDLPGYRPCASFPGTDQPVKAVYFGALGMNKGGQLVKGMLEYNRRIRSGIELHILGNSNLPFKPGRMGSVNHGQYRREDLPQKLSEIAPAVAIIPSEWPETYCHTLTEAWAAGIPVLGSDLGAVGERIRRTGAGWVLPPTDPKRWVDTLVAISGDKEGYDAVVQKVRNLHFKSVSEMGAEYMDLYENLAAEAECRQALCAG
ncbi:MAG: glycosyltransferase [Desulfosalsimonadaceae bacterium]